MKEDEVAAEAAAGSGSSPNGPRSTLLETQLAFLASSLS